MKILGVFTDWFTALKEKYKSLESEEKQHEDKRPVKLESTEQLANYVREQQNRDYKKESSDRSAPISFNDDLANKMFLFRQIDLIPDGKPRARECKHLLRMRVARPDVWNHLALSRLFRCRIDQVQELERIALDMVSAAIERNAKKVSL